jgi:Putative peptidoglycan binding domain
VKDAVTQAGFAGQPSTALVLLILAAAGLGIGCMHSRSVAPPPASALAAVEVDSSGVPFAPAPEGLLRPGAVHTMQRRLREDGFSSPSQRPGLLDAPTRDALRRFQVKKDLPATGLPSYRSVEALGLDSDQIFFSSHRPPASTGVKKTDAESIGPWDVPKPP